MIISELPFVGRQNILKTYKEKLSRAINYEGNILAISGSPGTGKTRILQEFANCTNKESIFIINIRFDASINSYELIALILDNFLNRPRVSGLIPFVVSDEFYNIYVKRFPILKSVFPYEPKEKAGIDLNIEMGFPLVKNLARLSPVVFIFDDLQNADNEVKEFINTLSKNIHNMPILIVMGTRDEEKMIQWINKLKSVSPLLQLEMEPLNIGEIQEINDIVFNGELPPKVFEWIYEKTRGYPLFTKEFILLLLDKGIIYFDKESWKVTEGYREISIPDSLSLIVKEQLGILQEMAQKIIKQISLISTDSFNLEMLDHNKIPREIVDDILHSHLIVKQKNGYGFVHPLIKETIYNLIPEKEKKNLHNSLGVLLLKKGMKEEAVNQFLYAGEKNKKILNLLNEIIDNYKALKNFQKALIYEEKFLQLLSTNPGLLTPQIFSFFIDSTNSVRRAGKYNDALKYYKFALNFLKKHPAEKLKNLLPMIYKDISFAELRLGHNEAVIRLANKTKRLIKFMKLKTDPYTMLTLETNRTFAYANLGAFKRAVKLAIELKQQYEKLADLNQKFRLNYCIANVYHRMGEWRKAIPWAERALGFAKEINDARYIAATSGNLGIANMFTGNFKKAEELFLIHQNSSIKNGWIREEFMSYLNFGNLYFFQGYQNRAEDEFNKALKIAERLNLKTDLFWVYHSFTYFLIVKDDYETAREFLKKMFNICTNLDENPYKQLCYSCEGFINALEKKFNLLHNALVILKNTPNKEEYFLLKGYANLPKKEAGDDIEKGIKIVSKKQDYIKLFQLLIITYKIISNYKSLAKDAKYYKDRAIECASNYGMKGWLNILCPEKFKIEIIPLKINTFGRLVVELPDKRIVKEKEWQWAKPRQLFTILLNAYLKKNEMTRDELGSVLWPELPRDKLVNNFHVCLSQLKSVIGKEYLELKERTYRLVNVMIDAEIFRDLIIGAKKLLNEGKVHTAEETLLRAIDIYKGRFLDGFYDDWLFETRLFFSEEYRQAIFMLCEIYLKKAKTHLAIELVTRLLSNNPMDEEAHRFLISCYIQAGEKARAIEQYKRCEGILKKELGCEPSEKTRELYRSLL